MLSEINERYYLTFSRNLHDKDITKRGGRDEAWTKSLP